jgi:hypothetical protein
MESEGSLQPLRVGWREWLSLPGLGIPAIKAKVDTGARTSCLHVCGMETYMEEGAEWVRFVVQPLRKHPEVVFNCAAPVLDRRNVTDSGGHTQPRIFIQTEVLLGGRRWQIELNLTRRDNMLFPMLLGRTALHGYAVVEPGESFCQGKLLARTYSKKL